MIKIITNPDKEFAKEIREKIKENKGHCACAIVFDDDNLCMCKEFRDQISEEKAGKCHCELYELIVENI